MKIQALSIVILLLNFQYIQSGDVQEQNQKCKIGQYLDKEGDCNNCQFPCVECVDSTKCTTCDKNLNRELRKNYNSCDCMKGYYEDKPSQKCLRCEQCKLGYYSKSKRNYANQCPYNVSECLYQCDKKCSTCEYQSFNCIQCKGQNRNENPPQCTCQDGFHDDHGKLVDCQPCPDNCKYCRTDKICLQCKQNFFLNQDHVCQECYFVNGSCVQECPKTTELDQKTRQCKNLKWKRKNKQNAVAYYLLGFMVFIVLVLVILLLVTYFRNKRKLKQKYVEYQDHQELDTKTNPSEQSFQNNNQGGVDILSQGGKYTKEQLENFQKYPRHSWKYIREKKQQFQKQQQKYQEQLLKERTQKQNKIKEQIQNGEMTSVQQSTSQKHIEYDKSSNQQLNPDNNDELNNSLNQNNEEPQTHTKRLQATGEDGAGMNLTFRNKERQQQQSKKFQNLNNSSKKPQQSHNNSKYSSASKNKHEDSIMKEIEQNISIDLEFPSPAKGRGQQTIDKKQQHIYNQAVKIYDSSNRMLKNINLTNSDSENEDGQDYKNGQQEFQTNTKILNSQNKSASKSPKLQASTSSSQIKTSSFNPSHFSNEDIISQKIKESENVFIDNNDIYESENSPHFNKNNPLQIDAEEINTDED